MTWKGEYAELIEMQAVLRLALARCSPFLPVSPGDMAWAELALGGLDRSCQRWLALRTKEAAARELACAERKVVSS